MSSDPYYHQGQQDHHAWVTSRHYKQFEHDIPAEAVMKLFMPVVPQDMMQVQRPLPANHQAWLRGFNDARRDDELRSD